MLSALLLSSAAKPAIFPVNLYVDFSSTTKSHVFPVNTSSVATATFLLSVVNPYAPAPVRLAENFLSTGRFILYVLSSLLTVAVYFLSVSTSVNTIL